MLDCILDSMEILMHELYNYEVTGIDYILGIKTQAISLLDIDKVDEMYQQGYTQTKKKMSKIKKYLYQE